MSEKQTKNTKEILSNVWNWEHTEDGGRRAIPNPHLVLTTEKMLQEIQNNIGKDCMIGDVLDWINTNIQKSFTEEKPVIYDGLDDYRQEILYKWVKASKPIDNQSPETIKAIWEIVCK